MGRLEVVNLRHVRLLQSLDKHCIARSIIREEIGVSAGDGIEQLSNHHWLCPDSCSGIAKRRLALWSTTVVPVLEGAETRDAPTTHLFESLTGECRPPAGFDANSLGLM